MSLSKAFTVMRAKKDISSLQLAKELGCSVRNVQTIMSNKANPKFATIALVCEAMGATVGELIHEYELIKGLKK